MSVFNSKPPSSDKAATVVARCEAKLSEAAAALEQARSQYATAALAMEEETGSQADITKARKAVASAAEVEAEARATLEAARQRHEQAMAAEREAETTARWEKTAEHVNAREKAASDVQQAADNLAEAMDRLCQENAAIHNTCPGSVDLDGALLRQDVVHTELRKYLHKTGLRWAAAWPLGADSIRPFSEAIKSANAYVLSLRDKA